MTRSVQAGRQTTLQDHVTVAGIGVHSGSPANLTLHPAEADTGIVFLRCGVDGQPDREFSANFRSVTATEFATVLGDQNGPAVSTTEHVLAALAWRSASTTPSSRSTGRKCRSWTAAPRRSSPRSIRPAS